MLTTEVMRRPWRGFSLTELSVTVASIGVLLAIGLPTMGRLAGRARTTLCLTRIGQMTQAFIAYSQDYDGVFPFSSTLHTYGYLNQTPDPIENWLVDCNYADPNSDPGQFQAALAAMNNIAYGRQADWTGPNVPRSGSLFAYAVHEEIYRCPEFERVSDPMKSHNVFNYTRSIWARRYLLPIETGWAEDWGSTEGPILRVADIHRPDLLQILFDEQWNRFVACQPDLGDNDGACYNCNDYGFGENNNIGVYHGPPVASELHEHDWWPGVDPFVWPQGGVAFYDGHASLMRDPWPTFELGSNRRRGPWRAEGLGARLGDELMALQDYLLYMIHAQRGAGPNAANPVVIW
ncbi:MAG: hypothetical protein JXQ73_20920 [Phycisphaerae bacterium]|nr:hypothetical protein [Phycisphaerae bacterium]